MRTIEIHRDRLLPIIRENQKKHDEIFAGAVSGYWEKAEQVLSSKLNQIKNHQKIDSYLDFSYPENHADDYTRQFQ